MCVRERGWNIAPILQVRKWITICFTSLLFKMFFILPLYVCDDWWGPNYFNLKGMFSFSWPLSRSSLKFAYAMQILGYALACQLLESIPMLMIQESRANCWKVFQCLWYRTVFLYHKHWFQRTIVVCLIDIVL